MNKGLGFKGFIVKTWIDNSGVEKVLTRVDFEDISFSQACMLLYELEKIKQNLLSLDFEDDLFIGKKRGGING